MSDVRVGDQVLSIDPTDGRAVFSEVIAFLDRNSQQPGYFYTLTTSIGIEISLTAKHILYVIDSSDITMASDSADYVTDNNDTTVVIDSSNTDDRFKHENLDFSRFQTLFAEDVRVGHIILVAKSSHPQMHYASSYQSTFAFLWPARITHVRGSVRFGVYAPLTMTGTIVVDGVATSCYAFINNVPLAHSAFAPMRGWHELTGHFPWLSSLSFSDSTNSTMQKGVHLYAQILYNFASLFLSSSTLYVP